MYGNVDWMTCSVRQPLCTEPECPSVMDKKKQGQRQTRTEAVTRQKPRHPFVIGKVRKCGPAWPSPGQVGGKAALKRSEVQKKEEKLH